MNEIEHRQLVFLAARFGAKVSQCCGLIETEMPNAPVPLCQYQDKKLVQLICQRCRDGFVSGVWSVHDHGKCKIYDQDKTYYCLVEQYRHRLELEEEYTCSYTNNLTPFEYDYAVYIAARRCRDLSVCDEHFLKIISRGCHLCRQGARAWLPDIHEDENCLGGCADKSQEELAKKCWANRAPLWYMDGYRLARDIEYL